MRWLRLQVLGAMALVAAGLGILTASLGSVKSDDHPTTIYDDAKCADFFSHVAVKSE